MRNIFIVTLLVIVSCQPTAIVDLTVCENQEQDFCQQKCVKRWESNDSGEPATLVEGRCVLDSCLCGWTTADACYTKLITTPQFDPYEKRPCPLDMDTLEAEERVGYGPEPQQAY
jgi:hypothetical protein